MLGVPEASAATSLALSEVVANARTATDPEVLAERTAALNGRAARRRAIA